jgi:hypothetical protein
MSHLQLTVLVNKYAQHKFHNYFIYQITPVAKNVLIIIFHLMVNIKKAASLKFAAF